MDLLTQTTDHSDHPQSLDRRVSQNDLSTTNSLLPVSLTQHRSCVEYHHPLQNKGAQFSHLNLGQCRSTVEYVLHVYSDSDCRRLWKKPLPSMKPFLFIYINPVGSLTTHFLPVAYHCKLFSNHNSIAHQMIQEPLAWSIEL